MVKAIIQGRKSQTRRLVKRWKIQLERDWAKDRPSAFSVWDKKTGGQIVDADENSISLEGVMPILQGDVLYVREEHYRFGSWKKNGLSKTGKQKWIFKPSKTQVFGFYSDTIPADFLAAALKSRDKKTPDKEQWYKRNSLFMPKSIARIFLEITSVRVERACDVSSEDAIAEGIDNEFDTYLDYGQKEKLGSYYLSAQNSFKSLWNKINGPETWDNWVFVYGFKRIEPKP